MTTASPRPVVSTAPTTDPLQLIDVDHVRFYVRQRQAGRVLLRRVRTASRSNSSPTSPPATATSAHYLLTQGNIRVLLADHRAHQGPSGDRQASVGLRRRHQGHRVHRLRRREAAYERALRKNGGESAYEPRIELKDEHGTVTMAGMKTYGRDRPHLRQLEPATTPCANVKNGGTLHAEASARPIGHLAINEYNKKNPCGLKYVDHLVGNVELGKMNHWVKWYEDVLEFKMFKHFDDGHLDRVLGAHEQGHGQRQPPHQDADQRARPGKKKSQVQEYLDWHCNTPGVQHLALRTDDELHSIAELRVAAASTSSRCPTRTTSKVWDRVNTMLKASTGTRRQGRPQRVRDLGILVDADDEGYLLQLFTKPLQDRPTLFFEIICRRAEPELRQGQLQGAVFEALELEQERRGNL
jgi:4-hydroxyphenylpyruvate dioxygenase